MNSPNYVGVLHVGRCGADVVQLEKMERNVWMTGDSGHWTAVPLSGLTRST